MPLSFVSSASGDCRHGAIACQSLKLGLGATLHLVPNGNGRTPVLIQSDERRLPDLCFAPF